MLKISCTKATLTSLPGFLKLAFSDPDGIRGWVSRYSWSNFEIRTCKIFLRL